MVFRDTTLGCFKLHTDYYKSELSITRSLSNKKLITGYQSNTSAYSNHLGNVLAVVTDRKLQECNTNGVQYYKAEIVTTSDYYPFGMLMQERSFDPQATACSDCGELKAALQEYSDSLDSNILANKAQLVAFLNNSFGYNLSYSDYECSFEECGITFSSADLNFDGSSTSKVTFTDESSLHFGTRDFSVEAWVYIDNNNYNTIVGNVKENGTMASGWRLSTYNGKVYFNSYDGDEGATTISNNAELSLNTWHHIVVEKRNEKASDFNIYVDGVGVSESGYGNMNTGGDVESTGVNHLTVGLATWGSANFEGKIKDVRIYAGLLGSTAVSSNYSAGRGSKSITTANLRFWAPLDEGSGSTSHDQSSYKRSGTIGANATWTSYYELGMYHSNDKVALCENGCGAMSRYRFGFNGYESLDNVSGRGSIIDFGMRIYDSRLGRFFSTDPIVYPYWSPYQYDGNSPISVKDILGLGVGEPKKETVEKGQTPSGVAAKNNLSLLDFAKLNPDLYKGSDFSQESLWNKDNWIFPVGVEVVVEKSFSPWWEIQPSTTPRSERKEPAAEHRNTNDNETGSMITIAYPKSLSQLIDAGLSGVELSYLMGPLKEDILKDRLFLQLQNRLIDQARSDPRYMTEKFSFGLYTWTPITIGAEDISVIDGLKRQSWTVNHAHVQYRVRVNSNGNISIEYRINDILDLKSGDGPRSKWYERVVDYLGDVYHGSSHANEMQVRVLLGSLILADE